jgi:hypothetical protein
VRLKSIEEKAKALTLDFQLDDHLGAALKKLVANAEKELASAELIMSAHTTSDKTT